VGSGKGTNFETGESHPTGLISHNGKAGWVQKQTPNKTNCYRWVVRKKQVIIAHLRDDALSCMWLAIDESRDFRSRWAKASGRHRGTSPCPPLTPREVVLSLKLLGSCLKLLEVA
jgi:hypothetical protein